MKEELSQREIEVIACLLIGERSYKVTGRLLGISPKTVETHLRRSTEKYHCTKFELINIIGQEKLRSVYQAVGNNEITEVNSKEQSTKHKVIV